MKNYRISFRTLFGDGLDVTRITKAESLYQAYCWAWVETRNNPFYEGPFHITRVEEVNRNESIT